ncbi:MAG: Lipoate-protein ligase A [uncultured Rubrobacteraceae bacterium]|uniref:Lipoate-protein ligase A n=1 Tax=uncultured Rubrobacteraceae bacterium TaxID=349277 RepID=A0A6J4RD90_9ACTN|nr:MAG: Lipoate-protein ligase A [uncultured Rubrobacteraceae bacterium]
MELLTPERFEDPGVAYAYQRAVFEGVASGERPPTVSITPTTLHVGVTKRDTRRPGFEGAVRAANEEGYPVLVRGAGGGATAAGPGTLGFSIIRPSRPEEARRGVGERYDEAASFVLAAFARLGFDRAEVGEVRDEFCPGDHSIRVGSFGEGMKLVGIAQRLTSRAASVGGIVLVHGEEDLARVLGRVYGALSLPFRAGSVGSVRAAGHGASVEDVVEALAEEANVRYGASRAPVDGRIMDRALAGRLDHLVRLPA